MLSGRKTLHVPKTLIHGISTTNVLECEMQLVNTYTLRMTEEKPEHANSAYVVGKPRIETFHQEKPIGHDIIFQVKDTSKAKLILYCKRVKVNYKHK